MEGHVAVVVVATAQCCSPAPSFTLRALSVSLSQDALLSVPNGAFRGCTGALAWLSGDVALLLLKKQNPASCKDVAKRKRSCWVGWWVRKRGRRSGGGEESCIQILSNH